MKLFGGHVKKRTVILVGLQALIWCKGCLQSKQRKQSRLASSRTVLIGWKGKQGDYFCMILLHMDCCTSMAACIACITILSPPGMSITMFTNTLEHPSGWRLPCRSIYFLCCNVLRGRWKSTNTPIFRWFPPKKKINQGKQWHKVYQSIVVIILKN